MKEKIILAGFGGQGIMLSGMLLTYAGMHDDHEVSWLPSYGPEMRGGTASCSVTLSDKPISSPVILNATSLIVMNKPSLDKYESMVEAGGKLFVNSSIIDQKAARNDVKAYYIPANAIATESGSNKAANMVMLGAFLRITGILSREMFYKAMCSAISAKNASLIPLNMLAFDKGAAFISQMEGR